MFTAKRALLCAAIASCLIVAACSKSDDNNNNIVARDGLPLAGDQEVPVKVSSASGTMNISYDKTTRMLTYTINWSSLTGNPVGSHIHGTAARGVNAKVLHDFTSLIPKATSGTFSNSVLIDGVIIKEDSLLNGFYYLNIHTPTNPGGEIRGQIEFK